jgi:histidinol dehydrogenase
VPLKIVEGFTKAQKLLSRGVVGKQGQRRTFGTEEQEQTVRRIVDDVRERGDAALFEYTERFDGVRLTSLEIDKRRINRACREVDGELLAALKLAAERIASYHTAQRDCLLHESISQGLGWVLRPLRRIGACVPGFVAPLPSSLLMTVIPAKVAGVSEVILVTPPRQGGVSPVTLAAAGIAGVDRVFSVGGAQAVAALAYGTATIPAVDKICGPGSIYVTLAKKMVYGVVGIDGLYGPSEVVIIADETAEPEYCAADLLAQAEHGPLAAAILITTSRQVANKVRREVERQAVALPHPAGTESVVSRVTIVTVASIAEAVELANLYAPEHLCLVVAGAAKYVGRIANAGCLFVGANSLEALVDYVAGPSHVLPTEGTARFSSPLNVTDFVRLMGFVRTGKADIKKLGRAAMTIARAEGLEAHARAVEKRLGGGK